MPTDQTPPNNTIIAIAGILTVVTLFVSVFGLLAFYDMNLQARENAEGELPNDMLQTLHNEENSKLLSYSHDLGTNKIQIPIARAMELEAQKPWRPNTPRPTPTPTPVPGSTPAAAPAPAAGAPAAAATPSPAAAAPAPAAPPSATPAPLKP